jgi:hypothetical protein
VTQFVPVAMILNGKPGKMRDGVPLNFAPGAVSKMPSGETIRYLSSRN